MHNTLETVKVRLSAKAAPRPLVTPAWIVGDDKTFISADFQVDPYGIARIEATITRRHIIEEFQTIECDVEDAVDYATDLMSDARGTLYDEGVSCWEHGNLVDAVRDLVSKIQARQVA